MSGHAPSLGYRPEVDGLRAVAVIAVLLHHVWPGVVTGGFVGVDVFFVISGYLITRIIVSDLNAGTFSFLTFYQRRARRILPALLAMLTATMAAGWFLLLPSDYLATLRASLASALFSSNFVFWRDLQLGYFAADAKLNPLLHTWSLGVEEQFYLIFPLLMVLCRKLAPGRTALFLVFGLVGSLAASVALLGEMPVAVFFLTPFRAWELLVGSCLAVGLAPSLNSPTMRMLSATSGLVAILFSIFLYSPETAFPGAAAILPVIGTAAIIHAGGAMAGPVPQLLSHKAVVQLGKISYSLYLWHWPLVTLVRYLQPGDLGIWQGVGLCLASIGLAMLSYRFIEVPFRSQGQRSSGLFMVGALGLSAAVACISVAGVVSGGFNERVNERARSFDRQRREDIPFRACDQLSEWCVLGDPEAKPSAIFWGDSHMLAWAPAIDQVLRAGGRSGYLATHSACPPVLEVQSDEVPGCVGANLLVLEHVGANPIDLVVLAANWSRYQVPGRLHGPADVGNDLEGSDLLARQVDATIKHLQERGVDVAVMGPVPTYSSDVPMFLALSAGSLHGGRVLEPVPDTFSAVLISASDAHAARYVDVRAELCKSGDCAMERNGHALYRDDTHLSRFGALSLSRLVACAVNHSDEEIRLDSHISPCPTQ